MLGPNLIDESIKREMARLETWLACYAMEGRKAARKGQLALIGNTLAACHQALPTQQASARGL